MVKGQGKCAKQHSSTSISQNTRSAGELSSFDVYERYVQSYVCSGAGSTIALVEIK